MREMVLQEGAAWLMLMAGTYTDVREKRIRLLPVCAAALLGIILTVLEHRLTWEYGAGFTAGGCLLLLSLLTRGAVGFGDGLVILALAALLGGSRAFADLLGGLLLCALSAGYLLVFRHWQRQSQLPFLPFLLASHALVFGLCLV